jgi:GNAT superfamily N-acetyltransferase
MMLRRATAADAAALARLNGHVQGWHAAQYPKTFFAAPDPEGLVAYYQGRLAEPGCSVFLAGDPPVGYALCSLQARAASVFSPAIRRLLVEQIAVAPDARRKGMGRALLAAARALAHDLQVDEIVLDTWEANHDAHRFFRAEGFAPIRMLFRGKP